jgi:asparaginyl-tRNA synthetase
VGSKLISENSAQLLTLGSQVDARTLKPPYPRLTYDEAVTLLNKGGHRFEWGRSLGSDEQTLVSQSFNSPFWVTGMPKAVEPFPYEIRQDDNRVTKTADLLAPSGYGEILGVAQKICRVDWLLQRMKDKGLNSDMDRYAWYVNLRRMGSVPHSGMGMGVERVLMWLLHLDNVREAIPFPRTDRRTPNP